MSFRSEIDRLYHELPLEPKSFQTRLLELEKRPDKHNADMVSCQLRVHDLNDAPNYDALSYAWGRGEKSESIRVNGRPVAVTANLENALRNLSRSTDRRMIWADALCINQSDTTERNAQVSRMHRIFQSAKRTMAWIGDGNDDGEFALQFLRWYALRKLTLHPDEIDGADPTYETSGWRAVEKLMSRPYWRRLWVMQELALSHRFIEIGCGQQSLPWHLLVSALRDSSSAYHLTRLNRVRGAIREMERQFVKNKQPALKGRHLIFLLSHSAAFETSEAKDRIFALCGLLRVTGDIDFYPNYNLNVTDVYKQITALALNMKGGLDVLELKPWNQDPSLPSWVVDYSKLPPLQLPVQAGYPWQRRSTNPSPESEASSQLNIEEGVSATASLSFNVSGAAIDVVETVSTIDNCTASILDVASQESDIQKIGSKSLKLPLQTDEFRSFWQQHTRCQSHPPIVCSRVLDFVEEWTQILKRLLQDENDVWFPSSKDLAEMQEETPQCGSNLQTQSGEAQSQHNEALWPLLCRLSLMLHGRQLFRTERGFSGVSLADVRPGDQIVAFQSTKQLHVLRKTDQKHLYIGAAALASDPDDSIERTEDTNGSTETLGDNESPNLSLRELYKAVKDSRIKGQRFYIC